MAWNSFVRILEPPKFLSAMKPSLSAFRQKFCIFSSALLLVGAMTLGLTGCNPDQGSSAGSSSSKSPTAASSETDSSAGSSPNVANMPRFIPLGTAPPGGVFYVVGNAIASVLNEKKGNATWTVQANGTKGTQQNILMLEKGEIILGMSNASISYNAINGSGIWNQPYQIRSVATLAPNIGLFVTKKNSGIRTFADLKGKRIAVGPAGAGFESFLGPLMTAHGLTYTDQAKSFTPVPADYSTAVQLLGDGDIDAAFMGGALPMPAILQATSTMELHYIPFDDAVLNELVEEYPFFQLVTIPAKNAQGEPTYKGLEDDFRAINVGSMQLITDAKVNDDVIYELTKRIWENRDAIAAEHPAGRAINETNVVRNVGSPFHPGAIKFYQEIGIWKAD
jgi:uncharacterized protein